MKQNYFKKEPSIINVIKPNFVKLRNRNERKKCQYNIGTLNRKFYDSRVKN